jgi:hypothetical protein
VEVRPVEGSKRRKLREGLIRERISESLALCWMGCFSCRDAAIEQRKKGLQIVVLLLSEAIDAGMPPVIHGGRDGWSCSSGRLQRSMQL